VKPFLRCSIVVGLALALRVAPVSGQLGFHIGAGVTMPASEYGDYAKTGWMGVGGVTFSLGPAPLKIQVDALYGVNDHEEDPLVPGAKTSVYGGMGNAVYNLGAGTVRPYVLGGVGYLSHAYSDDSGVSDETEWKFAWNVGGGVNLGLGGLTVFAEARYLDRDGTAFIPIFAGLRFGS
jgi:opacity protein-like surface antigen